MPAFNETLVKVENLSRKYSRDTATARKYGLREIARNLVGLPGCDEPVRDGEFWALKDVSLEIERGESVAVMGLNGAGKSTLLKIIGGLMLPSRGRVTVRGSVGSLIELGTGFHPNLSGRENIYIKCALNGMSRREAARVYKSIVDFAELKEFIDMPVGKYSSGMQARLGFAAAVLHRPDVLLIDEILSVGDFTFRQKCLDRMNACKQSSAVVFVSHSLGAIRMFCDRGIVLEKGQIVFDGPTDQAVNFFIGRQEKDSAKKPTPTVRTDPVYGPTHHNERKIAHLKLAWADESGTRRNRFARGERICLEFSFRLLYEPANLVLGVPLWNSRKEMVSGFTTNLNGDVIHVGRDGWVRGRLMIDGRLHADTYQAVMAIHDGPEYMHRSLLEPLVVTGAHPRLFGSYLVDHRWDIECP